MNVIYTAISGHYDSLKPHPPIEGCQFIAFMDSPKKFSSEGWELRKLISCHTDAVRNSKQYKVLAHKILPEAEYSLWLDGNMTIKNDFDLDSLINKFLANHDIALFNHRKRRCAYHEANTCLRCRLDDPRIISGQMSKYRSEGYPENHGLTENRVLLRRHTPAIALLEDTWWREICEGSRRDQLSLNYSMWKTKVSYTTLSGTSLHNPFFVVHKHLHARHRFSPAP